MPNHVDRQEAIVLSDGTPVDSTHPLPTSSVSGSGGPSITLYAGTLVTSTVAAPLAATQAISEVVVQNDPGSTTNIMVGNVTAQTIVLGPGQGVTIPVANLATVYVKSASLTPTANYLGRS